jgi:hypothetical protein
MGAKTPPIPSKALNFEKKLGLDHQNIPFIQQPTPSKMPNTISGIEATLEKLNAKLY